MRTAITFSVYGWMTCWVDLHLKGTQLSEEDVKTAAEAYFLSPVWLQILSLWPQARADHERTSQMIHAFLKQAGEHINRRLQEDQVRKLLEG